MFRIRRACIVPLVLGVALGGSADVAHAQKAKRRGGEVREAWPADAKRKAPSKPLVRWLARQVGPTTPTTKKRRSSKSNVAFAAQSAGGNSLLLIRSFDIPISDAAYGRLTDASYTYDNALATFAFLSVGAQSQAVQLLDQLKALQRTDGSIEYAFNVKSGTSAAQVRAGAMAWVGYAALAYKKVYDSTKYDAVIAGVARYLLTLRNSSGLIKGGPDVNWVSTQHNLLATGFLRDLAAKLGTRGTLGTGLSYTEVNNAANSLGNAILANLIVQEGSLAYFRQGVGDVKIPADVQALGAMYLQARGDGRAAQVANYLQQRFYVAPRAATGIGTLSGFRPYSGTGAPDVIWSEGTIQASLALDRTSLLGLSATAANAAVLQIAGTVKTNTGPVGADKDSSSEEWGEYHTWGTSAAGSWLLIRASSAQLLFDN
ncbi:hypothetical protein OJ997_22705 [Solirubrobacter phytolaccae]|uniref:Alginate lyase domain-containing protein n=1 Tax=Solirubrobacter phytolaccae TaxID=1404360 RepID=A0A9X3SA05_9ACTN|nr:hypothetical protein [Solirubrobacter phytolaccae]MDA0183138.1 hypothetical protein [Solirubrobacter phytolaccae]